MTQTELATTETTIVDALNKLLSQEHACAIRYATHAAEVTGPYAESVGARLSEIGADEVTHAAWLRDRILALGGRPTMDVDPDGLVPAATLEEMLEVDIEEEKQVIRQYTQLLKSTPATNVILYQTLQDLVRDEQEHLEELQNLQRRR